MRFTFVSLFLYTTISVMLVIVGVGMRINTMDARLRAAERTIRILEYRNEIADLKLKKQALEQHTPPQ